MLRIKTNFRFFSRSPSVAVGRFHPQSATFSHNRPPHSQSSAFTCSQPLTSAVSCLPFIRRLFFSENIHFNLPQTHAIIFTRYVANLNQFQVFHSAAISRS